METVHRLFDSELCMFSKSPDQIDRELKANAVHEQLRRQAFWQSAFVDAGYDEAESSDNVTPGSINSSVLPFVESQFDG
ncbi:hypothetical protein SUGI_0543720 [Cryptomeria japonica]|nr:hypothetical protein SUGI_0543720 [Cryptomeria japonica]